MRYFSYNDIAGAGEFVVRTCSEEDIRKDYWPYWYNAMCKKYEQSYVDETYSFEDCLEDWCIVYLAWRSE